MQGELDETRTALTDARAREDALESRLARVQADHARDMAALTERLNALATRVR